ncbi:bifunctional tRNA (5-methylaminomethyl-2-thiouridine)(34)-methyltransferase MnmD/FAD-dependent 5-carboxymethylaminomethyl-2-thiouridine(34) oxidoreductase MnmC [Thalassotalea mangrovi]|uniref:bifunctional tRNA (5-methylaminomethyl-2-thiouridine)(34)-methyltransferase MnmD/FAD-dependent 5-carboxymethylaminomethyl-2-thiouridine(34) oxidoreductase MnmC n=1 Tax=Thalassotalea mangrovi TaxID=2572245 RepID=UPI00145DE75E|nr:bifunctional tRNA (5-methylaminomethyl-2-thiouridine)(34)-methyltransferase MnmD/FAD-dependent 5-carboxymethylaminomethyl-2-thiouridine(34) oxidoreductase MnmC [Thalassotalea mangrovi]
MSKNNLPTSKNASVLKKPDIDKQSLKTAQIEFDNNGLPYSSQFDDIYFDYQDGCSQSVQVFIEGNDLDRQWLEYSADKSSPFVIAETGFGTGLNFFLTLKRFESFIASHNPDWTLRFISTEKYPMTADDLNQALQLFPEFDVYRQEFLSQYQLSESKQVLNIRMLDNKVDLQIHLQDATAAFASLEPKSFAHVDAWFLDGFAPKKNPEMWHQGLFMQLARLSKPGTTLATFTVAGIVRRGLEKQGFAVTRKKHQQYKSQTLVASYTGFPKADNINGYKRRTSPNKPQHVTIIGGGLASACAAYSLVKRGIKVNVFCQDKELAQGASANAIGAIYPLLHQQKDEISEFYQAGFNVAKNFYQQLISQGFNYTHGFDGLIEVAYKDALKERLQIFEKKPVWPEELVSVIDAAQVNRLSGMDINQPGLWIPEAGWVSPPELVKAIFTAAGQLGQCKVKYNTKVESIEKMATGRFLLTTNKGQKQIQTLVLCTGADTVNLAIADELPLSIVRGQVSQLQATTASKPLKTVICHKGYLTPTVNELHCIGATFDKKDSDTSTRNADNRYNFETLTRLLGNIGNWQLEDIKDAKARLRCCTPDHLPMVGAMPDIAGHKKAYQHLGKDKNWRFEQSPPVVEGLYVMTGMGARGLCSAPLLAEILACELVNETYPVSAEQLFQLAPNRFIIRDLIRSKAG